MDDSVPFGSSAYLVLLVVLLFARGADIFSTWIATPNLVLEGNPIAKKLGWKYGLPLNFAVCLYFASWPLTAIILSTTSVLVAARNFQSAWLMRSLGEEQYRDWHVERIRETRPTLYLFCLFAQILLIGAVGAVLVCFSGQALIPFAVGVGIIAYAVAVVVFTLISLWRIRRRAR